MDKPLLSEWLNNFDKTDHEALVTAIEKVVIPEVAQLELKIKLLLKLIEYAARVLDNARMYDTAEYLLKEAGIDDETTE